MNSRVSRALPGGWEGRPAEAWAGELGVPRLELQPELPSTSDRLRELARAGAPPFTMVVAGRQSRGRGRIGRGWHSPANTGLWTSILVQDEPSGFSGVLPLAVGVAVARALERFVVQPVSLKWPNDVLLGDRKVGGILCETLGEPGDGIIVGIGLNLRPPAEGWPEELRGVVASADEAAATPVAEPVLARALVLELGRWVRPVPSLLEGRLLREWSSRDCLRGRDVGLEDGVEGQALGVGGDGSLQVLLRDGRHLVVRGGGVRLTAGGASPALHAPASSRFKGGGG